jgi:cytochrome c peroxidase
LRLVAGNVHPAIHTPNTTGEREKSFEKTFARYFPLLFAQGKANRIPGPVNFNSRRPKGLFPDGRPGTWDGAKQPTQSI